MKVMKSYEEVAKFIGCKAFEVEREANYFVGRNYFEINGTHIIKHLKDGEMHYISIQFGSEEDCNRFLMEYKVHDYNWKVFDINKWQECKVISVENYYLFIDRATVICKDGTKLNRKVKFIENEEDIASDDYIYFYRKVED